MLLISKFLEVFVGAQPKKHVSGNDLFEISAHTSFILTQCIKHVVYIGTLTD